MVSVRIDAFIVAFDRLAVILIRTVSTAMSQDREAKLEGTWVHSMHELAQIIGWKPTRFRIT